MSRFRQFQPLVERVAEMEHHRLPVANVEQVDFQELVTVGLLFVAAWTEKKTEKQLEKLDTSELGNNIRLALRHKLKDRYPWYVLNFPKPAFAEAEKSGQLTVLGQSLKCALESLSSSEQAAMKLWFPRLA